MVNVIYIRLCNNLDSIEQNYQGWQQYILANYSKYSVPKYYADQFRNIK